MQPREIRAELKRRCRLSTQAAVARELGISPAHLSDLLRGNRSPGPKVLKKLGIERVVEYRRTEEPNEVNP